MVNKQLNNF